MDIICTEEECHVSASLIQKTMDKLVKNKEPVVPKFIITYGPPGSGKTTMLQKAVYNNQINKKNTIEVNVDNVISKFEPYKKDLDHVRLLIEDDNLFEAKQEAKKAYFKYRQVGATFSDFILNMALLNRYNVIWETTGSSIQWSVKEVKRIRRYGYKIVIVYPYVNIDTLKRRVQKRSREELRFIDDEYIQEVSDAAQKNFMDLAKHVDEAYFYDNNDDAEPGWDPIVEFTNTLTDSKVKCNIPQLQKLAPTMREVLAQALLKKCSQA